MAWYYLTEENEVVGPVSEDELGGMLASGALSQASLVCREGTEEWVYLADVTEVNSNPFIERGSGIQNSASPSVESSSQESPGHQEPRENAAESAEALEEKFRMVSYGAKKAVWIVGVAGLALLVFAVAGLALLNAVSSSRSVAANFTEQKWTDKTFSEALELDELQERNADGKARLFLPNAENPVTGWVKEIEKNSRTLIHLNSGLRDGAWASFYKNGQLQFRGTYKEGEKHGLQESWYKSGQKESEHLFEDDLVSVKVWKPNGETCPESRYQDGNGKVISYADDGKPYSITTWEDGEGTFEFAQKEQVELLGAVMKIAGAVSESSETARHGGGRRDNSSPSNQNQEYLNSPDFEIGFRAGSIGSDLPFTNREAYLAGRRLGEKSESMPEYTQGYNQGREHGAVSITKRSNPFNKNSQKVEWLAWDHGYSIGNLEGQLSR